METSDLPPENRHALLISLPLKKTRLAKHISLKPLLSRMLRSLSLPKRLWAYRTFLFFSCPHYFLTPIPQESTNPPSQVSGANTWNSRGPSVACLRTIIHQSQAAGASPGDPEEVAFEQKPQAPPPTPIHFCPVRRCVP